MMRYEMSMSNIFLEKLPAPSMWAALSFFSEESKKNNEIMINNKQY